MNTIQNFINELKLKSLSKKEKVIFELIEGDFNYEFTNKKTVTFKIILSSIGDELYSDPDSYDFNFQDLFFFINKFIIDLIKIRNHENIN